MSFRLWRLLYVIPVQCLNLRSPRRLAPAPLPQVHTCVQMIQHMDPATSLAGRAHTLSLCAPQHSLSVSLSFMPPLRTVYLLHKEWPCVLCLWGLNSELTIYTSCLRLAVSLHDRRPGSPSLRSCMVYYLHHVWTLRLQWNL